MAASTKISELLDVLATALAESGNPVQNLGLRRTATAPQCTDNMVGAICAVIEEGSTLKPLLNELDENIVTDVRSGEKCRNLGMRYRIHLWRCAPTINDYGQDPTPEQLSDDAEIGNSDVITLTRALHRYARPGVNPMTSSGRVNPMPTLGGVSVINVLVTLPVVYT